MNGTNHFDRKLKHSAIKAFIRLAFCFFLCVAMMTGPLQVLAQDAAGSEAPETTTFIRIDRDDPAAYDRPLENLRLITGDRYAFREADRKYGIAPDYIPNETGLDTLNISASAQFNDWQFHDLAAQLREVADGKEIIIVDLRRESHALLNGRPFSVYGTHNWSNPGLSADEIMADETRRFSAMIGTTITAHPKKNDAPGKAYTYHIESFMTEKELVESEGLTYMRIPVKDHSWPEPEAIDQFISLIREKGIDHLWLHLHCHAGKGRTGAFLFIYDVMKNPDLPVEDIAVRQTLLGSTCLLYTEDSDSFKVPLYLEKKEMAYLFSRYVDENRDSGYALSWSEWLEAQEAGDAARSIPGPV